MAKRKKFLTSYVKGDGKFVWSILAADWKEAERICKLIGHELCGRLATEKEFTSSSL